MLKRSEKRFLSEPILLDEQGVAVCEEAIFFLHRLTICLHDQIVTCKGRAQHQKRALWRVKISDERI